MKQSLLNGILHMNLDKSDGRIDNTTLYRWLKLTPSVCVNLPMKILHFSDLHIGVENYGKLDPTTGLSTRLSDFLSSYDEMIDYAISEPVDIVILAGDVYKGRDPSQTHQREFAKRLSRLSSADIPTFVLVGNHDLPNSTTRANSVEIFPTLDVPHVFIGDRLDTYNIPTKSGPLQIIAVPWPRRGGILSREESRNLTIEQVREEIETRITSGIMQQVALLNPNVPCVLTAHATVNGATVGTERSMMLGNDHVLMVSSLQQEQIDYVALGHIHKHQVLRSESPMVVYSGSLERVDFSEELDDKGFCIIDLDPLAPQGQRMQTFEFRRVSARKFTTVDVDIATSTLNPNSVILDRVSKADITESIVRVRIKTPAELVHLINDAEIRAALSDAHYIAAISIESIEQVRPRLNVDLAEELDPLHALNLFLDNRNTDEHQRSLLIAETEQLLREIETDSGPSS